MIKKFVILIVVSLPLIPIAGYSQSSVTTPAPQVQQPPNFPEYIVRPTEDLDNFGLSTIDKSKDEYRTEGSTLGEKSKRPTNQELNKAIEDKNKEKSEPLSSESEEKSSLVNPYEALDSEVEYEDISATSRNKTNLIRWTDDRGVVHITNDFGSVPSRYRDQITDQIKK